MGVKSVKKIIFIDFMTLSLPFSVLEEWIQSLTGIDCMFEMVSGLPRWPPLSLKHCC